MNMPAPRESGQVAFGRTQIEYVVRRTGRRKTVSLAVDPCEGVIVTAPGGVGAEQIAALVKKKGAWIVERLRAAGRLEPRLPPREFVSGETFLYLGRQHRLRVVPGGGGVRMERGWLVVAGVGGPAAVRKALIGWYRAHAEQRIAERVPYWARRVGVAVPEVLVREQAQRWGSCSAAGIVRFNWRVVQAPMALVDYVVAHELVHLLHRNHTAAFWGKLGKIMPDYERRRERLKEIGVRMGW